MNTTTSHAALVAEVTALRATLNDAVELCESLRSERDALRAVRDSMRTVIRNEADQCDILAGHVNVEYADLDDDAQLLVGVASRLRMVLTGQST